MARLVVALHARNQLRDLMATRSLPGDAPDRVERSLDRLRLYPRLGTRLRGPHAGYRVIPGPWDWMAIVYRYDVTIDRVNVVAIQDTRTADAWTSDR